MKTKIITGVVLVLMLVVALWGGDHRETLTSTNPAVASSITATTGDDEVAAPLAAAPASNSSAVMTDSDDAGPIGCLLGVLCSLLILFVARRFALRTTAPVLTRTTILLQPDAVRSDRGDSPLSLTQLSISRT